jgi:predicted O-methyltransferase YrrM
MASRLKWTSDEEFTIDGIAYFAMRPPTADHMAILKSRDAIERYENLIQAENPRRIVELGIYAGGSTAFLAQLATPEKLVAIDLRSTPIPALENFLDTNDFRDCVSAYYGVDQSDSARLTDIMRLEFNEAAIDVVIDDASHLMHETRCSFNFLFPRLRPGGSYIIEDWSWPHRETVPSNPGYQGVVPLSAFVLELALVSACAPEVVADVTLLQGWALVHRGPASLDHTFDSAKCLDRLGISMVEALAATRSPS